MASLAAAGEVAAVMTSRTASDSRAARSRNTSTTSSESSSGTWTPRFGVCRSMPSRTSICIAARTVWRATPYDVAICTSRR